MATPSSPTTQRSSAAPLQARLFDLDRHRPDHGHRRRHLTPADGRRHPGAIDRSERLDCRRHYHQRHRRHQLDRRRGISASISSVNNSTNILVNRSGNVTVRPGGDTASSRSNRRHRHRHRHRHRRGAGWHRAGDFGINAQNNNAAGKAVLVTPGAAVSGSPAFRRPLGKTAAGTLR